MPGRHCRVDLRSCGYWQFSAESTSEGGDELRPNAAPCESIHDMLAPLCGQLISHIVDAEGLDNRCGHLLWIVDNPGVNTIDEIQTLQPDGRADHRPARSQRLESLESCSGPDSQGHDN